MFRREKKCDCRFTQKMIKNANDDTYDDHKTVI